MSRLDDFSARLAVVEYSTEQSKAYVHEATEEFKLKLEGFKDRLY
jgi:molybdopterin/thiamine biosynthesis adenylyltransferase